MAIRPQMRLATLLTVFRDYKKVSKTFCIFVAGNAAYRSLCRLVRPLVGRSIGPSVPLYFFGVSELFEGRIAQVLVSYGCLCPCPNHFCPCPTHYCPCPTTRDRGSHVFGLVCLNLVNKKNLNTSSVWWHFSR